MAKQQAAASESGIRLSRHPRARRHIALAKGWGGMGCFALVVLLSTRAGVPLGDAIVRGIVGGVAGYVTGWVIAQTVWRHLALAELESLRRRMLAEMEQQAAEAEARRQAGGDAVPQR